MFSSSPARILAYTYGGNVGNPVMARGYCLLVQCIATDVSSKLFLSAVPSYLVDGPN